MNYKSYQKSPCRPFDHLYDPNFICDPTLLKKLNQKALLQTAPLHIIPCYHMMFSSDHRRNFYLPQINPLPIEPPVERSECKCACFLNKNLLINAPVSCGSSDQSFKADELPNEKTFRSIKCQTEYRESEVQTEPYLPDAKLAVGETCIPEIACINITTQPTLKDIKKIERARFRRNWEKNLSASTASMEEKIQQLKVIEYENYLMQEKEMNELQEDRLQQVK